MNITHERLHAIRQKAQYHSDLFCITGAENGCAAGITQLILDEREACIKAIMNVIEPGGRAPASFFADVIRDME